MKQLGYWLDIIGHSIYYNYVYKDKDGIFLNIYRQDHPDFTYYYIPQLIKINNAETIEDYVKQKNRVIEDNIPKTVKKKLEEELFKKNIWIVNLNKYKEVENGKVKKRPKGKN